MESRIAVGVAKIAVRVAKVTGRWTWGYKISVVLYAVGCLLGLVLVVLAPATGIAAVVVYGLLWRYLHTKRRCYGVH